MALTRVQTLTIASGQTVSSTFSAARSRGLDGTSRSIRKRSATDGDESNARR